MSQKSHHKVFSHFDNTKVVTEDFFNEWLMTGWIDVELSIGEVCCGEVSAV